jgi:hypothetical protein
MSINSTNYEHAFECKECPQSNDKRGCPAWQEIIMENPRTGDTSIEKACLYVMMPKLLIQVIQAANRPAAVIESTRNELVQALGNMTEGITRTLSQQVNVLPMGPVHVEQERGTELIQLPPN